ITANTLRLGRSPWTDAVHVVWSVWVFITPAMSGGAYGYTLRWLLLTLVSFPLFLWLYAMTLVAASRKAMWCALGMVALCLVLLPWSPSGLSYFVFGCVMLQPRRGSSITGYLAALALLNALLLAYAAYIGYPWQAMVWMPMVTAIVGVV